MASLQVKVDVRERSKLLAMLREQANLRRTSGGTDFSFRVNDDVRHIGYVSLRFDTFRNALTSRTRQLSRKQLAPGQLLRFWKLQRYDT
jgi:hypothetical protein